MRLLPLALFLAIAFAPFSRAEFFEVKHPTLLFDSKNTFKEIQVTADNYNGQRLLFTGLDDDAAAKCIKFVEAGPKYDFTRFDDFEEAEFVIAPGGWLGASGFFTGNGYVRVGVAYDPLCQVCGKYSFKMAPEGAKKGDEKEVVVKIDCKADLLAVTTSKLKEPFLRDVLRDYFDVLSDEGISARFVEVDSREAAATFDLPEPRAISLLKLPRQIQDFVPLVQKLKDKVTPKYLVILGSPVVFSMPPLNYGQRNRFFLEAGDESNSILSDDGYSRVGGKIEIIVARIPSALIAGPNVGGLENSPSELERNLVSFIIANAVELHKKGASLKSPKIFSDSCGERSPEDLTNCFMRQKANSLSQLIFNKVCEATSSCMFSDNEKALIEGDLIFLIYHGAGSAFVSISPDGEKAWNLLWLNDFYSAPQFENDLEKAEKLEKRLNNPTSLEGKYPFYLEKKPAVVVNSCYGASLDYDTSAEMLGRGVLEPSSVSFLKNGARSFFGYTRNSLAIYMDLSDKNGFPLQTQQDKLLDEIENSDDSLEIKLKKLELLSRDDESRKDPRAFRSDTYRFLHAEYLYQLAQKGGLTSGEAWLETKKTYEKHPIPSMVYDNLIFQLYGDPTLPFELAEAS